MSRNLAMFKIPSQALEDPDLTEFIDGLMKDVLMQQRSMIESKVCGTHQNIQYSH